MTDHDRINDESAARLGDYVARELLRRSAATLIRWGEAHGKDQMPPGHVRLLDDIMEFLMPAHPIGRDASRPGDLVPLANGRSVDLGGRWTMPT